MFHEIDAICHNIFHANTTPSIFHNHPAPPVVAAHYSKMAEHHPLRTHDQSPTTAIYAQQIAEAEDRAKTCRSAEMPSLKHLRMRDYDSVYEPSDDTYLLIDAIGMDIDAIEDDGDDSNNDGIKRIKRTLEIGCGTGVPSVYLAMRLRGMNDGRDAKPDDCDSKQDTNGVGKTVEVAHGKDYDVKHFVTDINPDAIRIAQATADINNIPSADFHPIQCDLASQLLPEMENKIDVLIFNPPYVPTPDEEVGSNGIEASWAGGTNGRVVLDRALPQIAQLLAFPHGVAYVVVVDDNYPEELAQRMMEIHGIKVVPWARRRARNEFLTILKMTTTKVHISS
jgi:release factor glutamine methyltransferase